MSDPTMSELPTDAPSVSVVAGSPTPEELAAIVTVLTAAAAISEPVADRVDRPPAGGWRSHQRTLRKPAYAGPGAWRHGDR